MRKMKLVEFKITCIIPESMIKCLNDLIYTSVNCLSKYHSIKHITKTNFSNKAEICGVVFKSGVVFKNTADFIDKVDKDKGDKKLTKYIRDIRYIVYSVGTRYVKMIEINKNLLDKVIELDLSCLDNLTPATIKVHYYTIIDNKISIINNSSLFSIDSSKLTNDELIARSETNHWELEDCIIEPEKLQYLFDRAK